MTVLPDKVSHGGTYAGNRVAAAAAVKTLEILRDTDALATIHATRPARPGRPSRGHLAPTGLPYVFTGHPAMFGIMFTETSRPSTATGPTRTTTCTTRSPSGMHARGAMPEPDSREPWFMCEAHAQDDIVDRVVSASRDSLDAALEARAHGRASVRPMRPRWAALGDPGTTRRPIAAA